MSETWTPTERRILDVLSDGDPHPVRDLIVCLPDSEGGDTGNVADHVSLIRRKLRPLGHDIVLEIVRGRSWCYRRIVRYRRPSEE